MSPSNMYLKVIVQLKRPDLDTNILNILLGTEFSAKCIDKNKSA